MKYMTIFLILVSSSLSAINRPIYGIITEGVNVTCDEEGMLLFREGRHRVAAKNLSRTLSRTCDFQVTISNLSEHPIPFDPAALSATDQTGRVLECVPKSELITALRQKHAQRESDLERTYFRERAKLSGALEEAMAERILLEKGDLPRMEGPRDAMKEEIKRILKAERELRYALEELPRTYRTKKEELLSRQQLELKDAEGNYIQPTQILPGTAYRATLQIRLPRHNLKEMRYITLTTYLEGEDYLFTFQVEQRHLKNS